MRFNIWEEDDFFQIGDKRIDMDPSVVKLPEETPLVWQMDWNRKPIGKVTAIRAEGATITGEVEWLDPQLNDDTPHDLGTRFGGYYTDVKYTDDSETEVGECTLRGVSLVLHAGFPSTHPKAD